MQDIKPFFSVIIPTYNRAHLLGETLRSVQTQTFTDWECIVVDDGSTDNTRQLVEGISQEDTRIQYVWQLNAERSAARNNGIRHAQGQYVCFLDSDDLYLSTYLSCLHDFLARRDFPVVMVASGFYTWDGETRIKESIPYPEGNVADWLFRYAISPSRACVHHQILKKHRFRENISFGEDSILWVSLSTEYTVLYQPEPHVLYRRHDDNSIATIRGVVHRLNGLKNFFKDPLSKNISPALRKELLADATMRMAQVYAYKKNPWKAAYYFIDSILMVPRHPQTKHKLFLLLNLLPFFGTWWAGRKGQKAP